MMDKLKEVLNFSLGSFTVGKLLAAVITFVVCFLIIKIIMKLFSRLLSRLSIDDSLKKIIKAAVKLILYFIAVIIVIDALGISVTSLIAMFSVVGLAASLAVQDSLSNLASGIMILVTKPFKIGDYVDIDNVSGTIAITGLIHTRIKTVDNKIIYVPNSKIIATKIVNYTSQDIRRVDIDVSASYDAPIDSVRASLLDAIAEVGLFKDEPAPPFVAVQSYDESSIKYVVRAWTTTEDYWDAHFALMENIKKHFDMDSIEMTYNHLNVHIQSETK
ncbi:MAG: mechanosensitive ion channel family protein [Oscillospiraceae bacterium]